MQYVLRYRRTWVAFVATCVMFATLFLLGGRARVQAEECAETLLPPPAASETTTTVALAATCFVVEEAITAALLEVVLDSPAPEEFVLPVWKGNPAEGSPMVGQIKVLAGAESAQARINALQAGDEAWLGQPYRTGVTPPGQVPRPLAVRVGEPKAAAILDELPPDCRYPAPGDDCGVAPTPAVPPTQQPVAPSPTPRPSGQPLYLPILNR